MEKTQNIKTIVKSIFLSYLITLILTLIYSVILAYTKVPETTIPTCVFIIGMISVFMASSVAVIKIKKNGLKNGGIIGFCYVMILYLLSSIYETGFALTKYSIATIIFYAILGMLGGIIGVNLATKR